MSDFKLHMPTEDNSILHFQCGLVAGQQVVLRKDLVVRDHEGRPTGEVHLEGEIWTVLSGFKSDPVLWFRQADGKRHTWDDDAEQVNAWFETVH